MDGGELVRIAVLLFVVCLFVIFIALDAWKANKKGAHWVPSHFLVLSALIIQLLNLLSGRSALSEESWDEKGRLKQSELWMIHSGRVMLCVVMAYLVPSMAARGSQEFWGKMTALGITIIGQMTSELYSVNSNTRSSLSSFFSLWPSEDSSNELAFVGSTFILSISFIILTLLLGCANFASRGIQDFFAQRIPLVLKGDKKCESETTEDAEKRKKCGSEGNKDTENKMVCEYKAVEDADKRWTSIEDEVLKAWIVARAYTPEYIIAKSALSSSAAVILSLLIWSSIAGWLKQGPFVKPYAAVDWLKLTVTFLQVIFILIGWAIIAWRWIIAAWFYTRWGSVKWRTVLRVEDYWTRYIKDLIDDRGPKLQQGETLRNMAIKLVAKQPTTNQMPRKLLKMLELLQLITVLFSKICWFVSMMIFQNRWTSKLMKYITSKYDAQKLEMFREYEEILNGLGMLGETPESLWIANKHSIVKAQRLIINGNHSGEANCKELATFLTKGRSEGIDPTCSKSIEASKFKCLWKTPEDKYEPLNVEKQFEDATRTSWKMTAVCLIRIILQLSPMSNSLECPGNSKATSHDFPPTDSLEAYCQAWEILDFVDAQKADVRIPSEAADAFFLEIKDNVDKEVLPPKRIFHSESECVASAIKELADEGKEKAGQPRGLNILTAMLNDPGRDSKKKSQMPEHEYQENVGACDSMDWKNVVAGNALYKLCKRIDFNRDAKDLFEELQRALAEIILGSIEKAAITLVSTCREWARDSNEIKIAEALYTAGKARTLVRMVKREKREKENAEQQKRETREKKENAEQQKRDVQCLEITASRSEKCDTNPLDSPCLEIVTSS